MMAKVIRNGIEVIADHPQSLYDGIERLNNAADGKSVMRIAMIESSEGNPSAHYFYRIFDSAVYFEFSGHVDDESRCFYPNAGRVMVANDNRERARVALSHMERIMREQL